MKHATRSAWALGAMGMCAAALWLSPALSGRALAFGGLWSAQGARIRVSAAQVILVDNPDATLTAIVRLQYEGPPQGFAWLIPVPGTPTLELSSNTVFERLEAATAPEYWLEVGVEGMCAGDADAGPDPDQYAEPGATPPPQVTSAEPIRVLDQGSVGAYDYVTLMADPALQEPAEVATQWLTQNGYAPTDLDAEALEPYLRDGLNLLAVKLNGHAEEGGLRPFALTYASEQMGIPLLPTAVAATDDMPLQVWVVGPAQAVPDNYKSLVINDALYDWLSCRKHAAGTLPAGGVGPFGGYVGQPSNYDAVVTAAADEAGGHGFVTELGGPASQYRDKIWGGLDDDTFAVLSNQRYDNGIEALVQVSREYGGWDGFQDAVAGATTLPSELTIEAFLRDPDAYREQVEVDSARLFELLEADVLAPVAAAGALLHNGPYLTRLYTTLSAHEMTLDPVFAYNADLAQVSNVHIARQILECESTLQRDAAPWRVELPQGGLVVGVAGDGWPVAAGSLPANLKIVTLGASGSGSVDEDNSGEIASRLFDAAGRSLGLPEPPPPQHGLVIGGSQRLAPPYAPTQTVQGERVRRDSGGDACAVPSVRGDEGSALAAAWPLVCVILALRRLRRRGDAAR